MAKQRSPRLIRLAAFWVLTALMLTGLSGCITKYYDFEDLEAENIQSIQFYNLAGADSRDAATLKKSKPFFILPQEDHSEFLTQLKKIKFSETLLLLPVAQDPSFSYGEYVVRFVLQDGSYQYLSCDGYNQRLDAQGHRLDSNHFGCDRDAWNDLIFSFAGKVCARFVSQRDHIIAARDIPKIVEILSSVTPVALERQVPFSDEYLLWNGKAYHLAEERLPYLLVEGRYYQISEAQRETLDTILRHSADWVGSQEVPDETEAFSGPVADLSSQNRTAFDGRCGCYLLYCWACRSSV